MSMKDQQDKQDKLDKKIYLFDKPKNVRRLLNIFYMLCVILVIADFILHRHIGFTWENIPAFYALYGFVACVALVVIAKKIRIVVMRKEDYYDE